MFEKAVIYNYYLKLKIMMIIISLFIVNSIIAIYNRCVIIKKKEVKKEDKVVLKPSSTNIDELEKKIEMIKIKNNEHEIIVRKYEQEIKLIDAYNKQYEYKIKLIETKGKILNDCLSLIRDVMNDVKKLET